MHLQESETAAQALGVEVRVVEAREPDDLVKSFEAIVKERAEAVMVLADPMFITHRRRIVELAAENRLPSIFGERGSVQAGGLMFYGASTPGPPTGEPGAKWRVETRRRYCSARRVAARRIIWGASLSPYGDRKR